jgi:hypothetical protein
MSVLARPVPQFYTYNLNLMMLKILHTHELSNILATDYYLSKIVHNIILDTTKVLLYPVTTPGLLYAKYNRLLVPTDTLSFLKLLHFPPPLIPTYHSPRGLMTKTTTPPLGRPLPP